MTMVISRRTKRDPTTRSTPPAAHTGPISVRAAVTPAASLIAPRTIAPANPPNTRL